MHGPLGISHLGVVTADLDRFRAFYEDVIGLQTTLVFGPGVGHARQAVLISGDVMLQVFEVPGYEPSTNGVSGAMFQRGRLDHFGLAVNGVAALTAIRDRLLAADATSGDIRPLGPMLSVRFRDQDGLEGEINCYNPDFDPSTLRDEDEVVTADWLERARTVLDPAPLMPPEDARAVASDDLPDTISSRDDT